MGFLSPSGLETVQNPRFFLPDQYLTKAAFLLMPSCVSVCLFIALGSKFLRQIGILKVVLLWIAARRLAVALWLTPATI